MCSPVRCGNWGERKIDLALKFLVWMHGKDGLSIYNGRILKRRWRYTLISVSGTAGHEAYQSISIWTKNSEGSLGCVLERSFSVGHKAQLAKPPGPNKSSRPLWNMLFQGLLSSCGQQDCVQEVWLNSGVMPIPLLMFCRHKNFYTRHQQNREHMWSLSGAWWCWVTVFYWVFSQGLKL